MSSYRSTRYLVRERKAVPTKPTQLRITTIWLLPNSPIILKKSYIYTNNKKYIPQTNH